MNLVSSAAPGGRTVRSGRTARAGMSVGRAAMLALALPLAATCQRGEEPGMVETPAPVAAAAPAPAAPPARRDFAFSGPLIQGGLVLGRAPSGTAALLLDGRPVPLAADGRFLLGL